MRLTVASIAIGFDSPKVSYSRAAKFAGIGVENFIPGATARQAKLEVVVRVTSKVDHDGNRVAGFVIAQEAQQVSICVAAIDPDETAVIVVELP